MPALTVTIRVKPGSSRNQVGGSYGEPGQLVVAVTAPAVDGRANEAVVQAVAAAIQVKQSQVTIVKGHTARTKVLAIDGADNGVNLQMRLDELLAQ